MKLWSWISNILFKSAPQSDLASQASITARRYKLAMRLERRLMFDGALVLTALAELHHNTDSDGPDYNDGADGGNNHALPLAPSEASSMSPREMIFIDPTVANYQTLLKGLPQDAQVVLLDPHKDGVEQIRAALVGHSDIESLHIVSHGGPGYLALGGLALDGMNVEAHTEALRDWGAALAEDADILIYGCDVGAGMTGGAFVSRLAELTGADVAASDDPTGATDQGGDWILEVTRGEINSSIFLSGEARVEYGNVLPSVNPIIANIHGDSGAYAEGSAAVVIDQGGDGVVSDADNVDFNGGTLTVAITANRDAAEDVLDILHQGGGAGQIGVAGANISYQGTLIGTFTGGSGTNDLVISFNANANVAAVSALLHVITYTNSDTVNPTAGSRSIAFSMTDGSGGASAIATANVAVSDVNDQPTLTAGSILNTTENDAATVIDNTVIVADPDNANFQSATIKIASNYQNGSDLLLFTNTGSITGSWNGATGTLTLTGSDTKANYQTALRSIKFQNTSDAPTTTPRTISYQVDDGAISSVAATATVNITATNDAPILVGPSTWYLAPVERTDTVNPTGTVILALFAAGDITDLDPTPQQGIAIYNRNNDGVGRWQYRIDGGAWTNLPGGLNNSNTLLLKSTDEIRYKPDNSSSGQPTLSFYAWDQTAGVAGDTPDSTVRGGLTEFSLVSGTICGTVNAAPVLDNSGTVTMTTITEDDTTNAGQTVSAIVGTLITDVDAAPVEGIAIQGLNSANGVWYYSTNAGASWNAIGVVSNAQSLLLRPSDLVRFVPDGMNPPNNASPGTVSFDFVAWDQSGQSATWASGAKVSTVSRGLATPFSAGVETASINVTDLNDAPVLTTFNPTVPDIMYTDTNSAGVAISTLVGASMTDVDAVTTPLEGIAIHTVNNGTGGGFWEFSMDNGTSWTPTGAVSSLQALLLRPQDMIRFQPNTLNTSDTASFSYYAWDQTQNLGGHGTKTDVTVRGGTTAFSLVADTASIKINVAPTLDASATPAFPTITENATTNAGVAVSTLLGGVADMDVGAARGIAVYGLTSGNGTWQYNIGSGWTNIGAVSSVSALLLKETHQIRFVPNAIKATAGDISFYAWDQTSGVSGTKVNVTSRGGANPFSVNGDTAAIIATEVNDTPVITVGGTFTFTEGNAATIVSGTLTLSDIDDNNIAGATVRITGNYLSSEDVLAFTNQSGIVGSWDAATGTMTLTGSATKVQYRNALRSITYQNINTARVSVANRTVTFTITDGNSDSTGGGELTASANRTIAISAVNDAPILSTTGLPLVVTEGDAPTAMDSGLILSDIDDANIAGATVQITGNYLAGEDLLSFTNQSGITGSWNIALGKMTLSGAASKADYQTALRSITYQNTNGDTPSVSTRTVTFRITDSNSAGEGAAALNAIATRNILLTAVNDAPGMTTTAAPLAYTEGGTVTVDAGLSLSDVDDANMVGATVQITGNYLASEDLLSFINQSGISGSWNGVAGTLTLTGVASKANYETALRSIAYHNTNDDDPSVLNRTVTFSVTDGNSNGQGFGAITTSATRDIFLTAVNDAPGVVTTVAPLAYTESGTVTVDAGLSLSDVDDANIVGATVQITGNYLASEDLLSFVNQSGISGSWNGVTGTLTLTGTASKGDYEAALRSITYHNINNSDPSVLNRTVTFSVTDGNSNGQGLGAITTSATRDIFLTAVNDAPGVVATAVPLTYTESGMATAVDPGLSLSDVDDANMVGATVQITGNYLASEDLLSFVNQSGISGSWNGITGTLTLTGAAPKGDYEAALRSITYHNTNDDNPSVNNRTVTFSVTDGNSNGQGLGAITTSATRDIFLTAVNDAPGVVATAVPLAYTESGTATVVDPGLSLSDVDDANMVGATVQITGNYLASEDLLSFVNQSGISGSWNGVTGTLTLTGTASKGDYEAALRSITYHNTNDDNPSVNNRTVTFSVTDGNSNGQGLGAITTSATRDIFLTAVNDAPGMVATAVPLAYTESGTATVVDSGLSLSDVDDASMVGATVQITGNYLASEDLLSFMDQSGISGSWNGIMGTLTLTGAASKGDYETALRSITYHNTNNDDPSVLNRTVTFSVTDGNSNGQGLGAITTSATRDIFLTAVNDAPGVVTTAVPLAYTESGTATVVDSGLSLSDVDDANMVGATVQITGNYLVGEDLLTFVNQSGISGSWNGVTGTLTLTGAAPKGDYETALRSITYHNTNDDNPSVNNRTVTFSVTDGNSNGQGLGAITTSATRDIFLTAVNDVPGVVTTVAPLAYTESGTVTVDAGLSLSDVDDANIVGATVQITGNYLSSEDRLSFVDQSGISGSWNNVTGMLTLTGSASKGDYETALRSITYNNINNNDPSIINRTVTFSVTDGNSNGQGLGTITTSATRDILLSAVNDAPGVITTAVPLVYVESGTATAVDPGLSLSDVDDANMVGATVQITGNYLASEDLLFFVDQSGISGSWNGVTGTLTLTGVASKVDYEAALHSITYHNTNNDDPSVLNRTVIFSVTDSNSNGQGLGAITTSATRDILLTAVNDAPGVTTTIAPLAYTESGTATVVDSGLSLSDVDDANMVGATVQITGNYLASEDRLSFIDQSGISGSWNGVTGTLTLTGAAPKGDYETALRSITYDNTNNDNPSIINRTVTFSVTDGNSNGQGFGAMTTSAIRDIFLTAVNDAPGVVTTVAPLAYTESGTVTVDAGLSLSDVDDANIVGATVQITGNYLASEDLLSFIDQSGISGSWNGVTGMLTLTGAASKGDYEAALRSITYHNINNNDPSIINRTVTFSVTDGNSNGQGLGAITTSATRDILLTAVNDAPGVTTTIAPLAYTESGTATVVDPGLNLADVDDANMVGATVQITGNYLASEDRLSFVDQSGISGSWNGVTGTLTLTGAAPKGDYETALRSITYDNTNNDNPSIINRTVTFSVTDGNSNGQGSGATTTSATRDIFLTAVNDAPGVTTTAAPLVYTESGTVTVDAGLSLSDVDDANIVGATVQITGNYLASEDRLSFMDQSGISGSWNGVLGTLTLTGVASKGDYEAALRSITYHNINNNNPSIINRTVTFSVTDGNFNGQGSGAITTSTTRDILLAAVNDAPGVITTAVPLAYTESGMATVVDPGLNLADVDDANMVGATVQITGNYLASEDLLFFVDQSGISGSWNGVTGMLTLTGAASKGDYEAALRSITYRNTNNDDPSVLNRTVTFSVTDGNSNGQGLGAITTSATRDIFLTAVNDALGVTTTVAPLAYTEGGTATVVDPGLSLSDVDDANMVGATVQITGNYLANEDRLTFVDQSGISGSWNGVLGTLTLTGVASKGDYEAALRSITYHNINNDNPSVLNRTVTFSVTDGNSNGQGLGAITTSATRDILLTAVNDTPVRSEQPLPDRLGREGDVVSFPFFPKDYFTDVDSPTLHFSVGELPTWLHFDPATYHFTGTPQVGSAGVYEIPVTAMDDNGALMITTFRLTIETVPTKILDEAKEISVEFMDHAPRALLPTSSEDLSPSAMLEETIRIPASPVNWTSEFQYSPINDAHGTLGETSLSPSATLAVEHQQDINLMAMNLETWILPDGEDSVAEDPYRIQKTPETTGNHLNGDALGGGVVRPSGSKRMDLQVGTTLRDHNDHLVVPPEVNKNEKNQKRSANYGIIEPREGEHGMLSLTSQLNLYGPKAFQAELRELVRTIKDAVS